MDKIQVILDHFGKENQIKKCIEECTELAEALEIKNSAEEVTQEIADVLLTIEQVLRVLDIDKRELAKQIDFKLNRTLKRIKEGYYENRG